MTKKYNNGIMSTKSTILAIGVGAVAGMITRYQNKTVYKDNPQAQMLNATCNILAAGVIGGIIGFTDVIIKMASQPVIQKSSNTIKLDQDMVEKMHEASTNTKTDKPVNMDPKLYSESVMGFKINREG